MIASPDFRVDVNIPKKNELVQPLYNDMKSKKHLYKLFIVAVD